MDRDIENERLKTEEDIRKAQQASRGGYFYEPSTLQGRQAKQLADGERAQYPSLSWSNSYGKNDTVGAGGGLFAIMAAAVIIATPFAIYNSAQNYLMTFPGQQRLLIQMALCILLGLLTGLVSSWIIIKVFRLNRRLLWLITFAIGLMASLFYLSKIYGLMYFFYDYYFTGLVKLAFKFCLAIFTGIFLTSYQYVLTNRKLDRQKIIFFCTISIIAFVSYLYFIP